MEAREDDRRGQRRRRGSWSGEKGTVNKRQESGKVENRF